MRIITLDANDVSWHINYQVLSPGLCRGPQHSDIFGAQRFPDPAPLVMGCDFESP